MFLRTAGQGVGVLMILAGVAGFLVYRFQHPALTETELFLYGWPLTALMGLGAALVYVLDRVPRKARRGR